MKLPAARWLRPVALAIACGLLFGSGIPGRTAQPGALVNLYAEALQPVAARVVAVDGSASVARFSTLGTPDFSSSIAARPGLALFRGDEIWTGADSWVEFEFPGAARVRVDSRSRVEIGSNAYEIGESDPDQEPTLRLHLGRIWVHVVRIVDRLRHFTVETPTAIAGVRGTMFSVEVSMSGRTSVSVREGVVAVARREERADVVLVGAGQETAVLPGGLLEPPRVASSDRARIWQQMAAWVEEQERWMTEVESRMRLAGDPPAKGNAAIVPADSSPAEGGGAILPAEFRPAEAPSASEAPREAPVEKLPDTAAEGSVKGPGSDPGASPGSDDGASQDSDGGASQGPNDGASPGTEGDASSDTGSDHSGESDDKKLPPGKDPDFVPPGHVDNGAFHFWESDQLNRLVEELEQVKEKIVAELIEAESAIGLLQEHLEDLLAEELKRIRSELEGLEERLRGLTETIDEEDSDSGEAEGEMPLGPT